MKNIGKTRVSYIGIASKLGIFASFLIVTIFAVYFYSPVIKTHAAENYDTNITGIDLDLPNYLYLDLEKERLDLSGHTNTFVSGQVGVRVSTNALLGYSLAIEDVDKDTRLKHSDENITFAFTSAFNGSKTSSAMDANTWGYSTDAANFYRIPEFGMPTRISSSNGPSPADPGYNEIALTFGAKIGDNAVSGVYTDTITLSAYANGPDDLAYKVDDGDLVNPTILYDQNTIIYDMQTFDCDVLQSGAQAFVNDIRDGNRYTVKKLNDGNCWMLQNLRLTNYTLTPADSNVASNFVLKASNSDDFVQQDPLNPNVHVNAVYLDSQYGAYYTWNAATAGTEAAVQYEAIPEEELANDEDFEEAYINSFHDIDYSVCPKGWNLPSINNLFYLSALYRESGIPIVNDNYKAGMAFYNPSTTAEVFMGRNDYLIGFNISNQGTFGGAWSSSYSNIGVLGSSRFNDVAAAIGFAFAYNNNNNNTEFFPEAFPVRSFDEEEPDGVIQSIGFTARCVTGSVTPPSLSEIIEMMESGGR